MPSESARVTLPPPAFALTPVAWSQAQLERLRAEWLGVRRAFAYHPFVAISALRGDPPLQYRADFRVRSLAIDSAEQLQYVDMAPIEIWIPPGYPTQPPLVRPLSGIFHPNISHDALNFTGDWQSANTLLDVVHRVGEYLAWRSYDPDAVVNDVALQWLADNPGLLPLDARADFTPTAGGEPLARISKFGPATLEQMRRSMAELIAALSAEAAAPTDEQVRAFGHRTRAAMRLFLEADIPAELRNPARDFDQCAVDLPASLPSWGHVRQLKAWAMTVRAELEELPAALTELSAEIEKLSGLVSATFENADDAARRIPPAEQLDPSLLRLPSVFTDAATRFEALRAKLTSVDLQRPPNTLDDQGVIAKHLKQQLAEADDDAEFARHTAAENIGTLEPALRRAREEVLALRLIGRWREYIDLFARATQLEQQVAQMNSDAVDGYFINSEDGTFGPFQLEQEVDLGTINVVVTAANGGAFEVRDAKGDSTLARGINGAATAMIPSGEKPPSAMVFRLAEGVDQPLLQLDYASRQTAAILPKLQSAHSSPAQSWCGKMVTLFADLEAQQTARSAHRRAHHRWKALVEELTELSQFKSRIATHFLITRAARLVPRLIAERAALAARVQQATQAIAAIAARSSRDEHTGQPIVSSKYAVAYTEQNAAVEAADKRIRRIDSRLKALSNLLRDRLASPRQCGRPEAPRLRKMQPLSAELTDLAPQMSDDALRATVATLAGLLKITLIANLSPPPPPAAHHPIGTIGALDTLSAPEWPVVSEGADARELEESDAMLNDDQTVTGDPALEREESVAHESAPPVNGSEFVEDVTDEQAAAPTEPAFAADDEEMAGDSENGDDCIEF